MTDDCLITVNGKEDHEIHAVGTSLDKSAEAKGLEHHFYSFETVICTCVGEPSRVLKSRVSQGDRNAARIMLGKSYRVGKGLGARLQGIIDPVTIKGNVGRFGLGYKPDNFDFARIRAADRKKRLARMSGKRIIEERMVIPHLRFNFPKAAYTSDWVEEPVDQDLRSLFAGLEVCAMESEYGVARELRSAFVSQNFVMVLDDPKVPSAGTNQYPYPITCNSITAQNWTREVRSTGQSMCAPVPSVLLH
jgi:hypothetical protein